jgi:hypothetical protein
VHPPNAKVELQANPIIASVASFRNSLGRCSARHTAWPEMFDVPFPTFAN